MLLGIEEGPRKLPRVSEQSRSLKLWFAFFKGFQLVFLEYGAVLWED